MSTQNDESLACRLSEAQKEARRPDVEALFRDGMDRYHETEQGYLFEFRDDDEVLARLFQFVKAEHACCPFFQFDVTVHPHDGPVEMEIGGSDRVKSFITDEMIPEVEAARES